MQNYFRLFELNYNLLVDDARVRQKFLQLVKENHPDHFANDPEKLEQAMQKTIEVNAGFNRLKNFEARVSHLLELCYKNSEADKKPADMEFLMEMMELNDRIEDMEPDNKSMFDSVNNELDSHLSTLLNNMQLSASAIAEELEILEPEQFCTLPQLEHLQQEFNKLNYIKRLKVNLQIKSK